MNAYPAPVHRTVIGFAALGATALILAASVVAPAKVEPRQHAPAAMSNAPATAEAPVALSRMDVVGSRETSVVSVRGSDIAHKAKQQI